MQITLTISLTCHSTVFCCPVIIFLLCVFPLIQTSDIKNMNSDYYYLLSCFISVLLLVFVLFVLCNDLIHQIYDQGMRTVKVSVLPLTRAHTQVFDA